MKRLYVFNPENDLALASDSSHFTPPAAALKLARAADVLPVWFAGDGDYVLASAEGKRWIDGLRDNFQLAPCVVEAVPADVSEVVPWGWSRYIRERMTGMGVSRALLPTDSQLDNIRNCSHRRVSITVYDNLEKFGLPYPLPIKPIEISDVDVVSRYLSGGKHIFLKSPLSGSGRGVLDSMSAPQRQIERLSAGMIRRQGSIILEPRLNKLVDFAMLFDAECGKIEFKGYSLFFNAGYSTYSGNTIASDEYLRARIESYGVPFEWVDATRVAVSAALESCVGTGYNGALGVDMMVYEWNGTSLIAPCVEVNLRMTMGRVAHELYERYVARGAIGVMQIVQHHSNVTRCDFRTENGRVVEGVVPLTQPSGADFTVVLKIL